MIRRDSAEKDRPCRPQSAKNTMLRYRPATNEPSTEQPEEEPKQPSTLKLKKRLPSANNSRDPNRKTGMQLRHQTSQQIEPNDFTRLLPKNIYQDKEFLYSELLQVKQQYNAAVEEITRLKTRVATLEKEKVRLSKTAEQTEPRSMHLRLKMAVGEVMGVKPQHPHPQSVKHLRLENEKLKRLVKLTDVQELKSQNKALFEELDRLKQLLQRQMSEGLLGITKSQNNKALEQQLSIQADQNTKLREELKRLEEYKSRPANPIEENTDKAAEISSLRKQIESLKRDSQYEVTAELRVDMARLERQLTIEKAVVKGLTEKLTLLESKDKLSTDVSMAGLSVTGPSSTQGSELRVSHAISCPNEELVQLGEFLSYKFMAQRCGRADLERVIDKVPQYNVHALNNILLGEPFFMNSQHHRKLFIDEITDCDRREISKDNINRLIDEIVPAYNILDNQQEQELYIGCSELITVHFSHLEEQAKLLGGAAGLLTKDNLTAMLRKVGFSEQQVGFTIGEISFFSDDLNSLNCYAMFDKFYIPTENLQPDDRFNLQHSYIEQVEEQFEQSMPYQPHEYI